MGAQTVLPLVNKIDVVYIKTADCDGCGMTDGQISLKICGKDGVGCCETGLLENGSDQVFARGSMSTFKGSDLGMEITHVGNDMGKFDYARVMVEAGRYQCMFGGALDGNDSEQGSKCSFLPWV